MPTNYPGSLDTLTNPTSTDSNASPSHAAQHANANDAIEAIEARLGSGNSVGTHTVIATDYGLSSAATAAVNQTALQAAVVAAENAGRTLYIPASIGTPYMLAGTVNITKPLIITGDGWETQLKLANASNAYIFTFTPGGGDFIDGAVIRDMHLHCNGANQTTGGGGINGKGAVWCKFERLKITEPWNNAIWLRDDNLGGFGHHNVIDACFFESGDASNGGDGRGVRLEQSDENTTQACTFQGMGRAGAGEANGYFDLSGLNTIIGCHFVHGETGVKIQGSHSRVIGNDFDSLHAHNILLNGSKNVISGNTLFNVGYTTPNTIDGLIVDSNADVSIVGNVFVSHVDGGARSAVNLSVGNSTNCVVVGNVFSILDGAAWGTAAIIPGSGTGHLISSNRGATKPIVTGSRAGNAALADLLTELAGMGLITDSSSA